MGEIGVRVGGGADCVLEGVPLGGDGLGAKPADGAAEEPRGAEGAALCGIGTVVEVVLRGEGRGAEGGVAIVVAAVVVCCGGGGVTGVGGATGAVGGEAVDAEEILQLLIELAAVAMGVLGGWHFVGGVVGMGWAIIIIMRLVAVPWRFERIDEAVMTGLGRGSGCCKVDGGGGGAGREGRIIGVLQGCCRGMGVRA